MKFSSAAFSFVAACGFSSANGVSIRGDAKSATKLMNHARRLDQNNGGGYNYYGGNGGGYGGYYGEMDENSMYFLRDYSIHLLSCLQGEQVVNYENGEAESSSIIFRLCPASSCDSSNAYGCSDGYGDYVVGINTFLEAYQEHQRENDENQNQNNNGGDYNAMVAYNQYGEEFNAEEYMECSEYNVENEQNDDQGQQQQQQQEFFIGPACSADGSTIVLGMFYEETCSYSADIDFAQVAYGWYDGLPFSEGGLVSMECVSCVNYDWETNELCTESYASSTKRCEEKMESYSYMGQATGGCEYISGFIGGASTVTNQVSDASSKFMDTLNTTEAGLFIAGMVILSIGFLAGMFITCFCCLKKKKGDESAIKENNTIDSYNHMDD